MYPDYSFNASRSLHSISSCIKCPFMVVLQAPLPETLCIRSLLFPCLTGGLKARQAFHSFNFEGGGCREAFDAKWRIQTGSRGKRWSQVATSTKPFNVLKGAISTVYFSTNILSVINLIKSVQRIHPTHKHALCFPYLHLVSQTDQGSGIQFLLDYPHYRHFPSF